MSYLLHICFIILWPIQPFALGVLKVVKGLHDCSVGLKRISCAKEIINPSLLSNSVHEATQIAFILHVIYQSVIFILIQRQIFAAILNLILVLFFVNLLLAEDLSSTWVILLLVRATQVVNVAGISRR